MSDRCLVCREVTGEIELPGGPLWKDEHAVGFHVPPLEEADNPLANNPRPYLGHLLIVTRRHVARFGDLSEEEAGSVGRAASRLARLLTEAGGAEWVYSAVIGRAVPHFHLHLLPRYAGTPEDVPWYAVDEWEGGKHGGAEEIAAVVERLHAGV
jgi:diadenosine tetraphosphate (Ap4A) HIT family hydrolase